MTRARDVATQGGLVLINKTTFSAVSSASINNVFNTTYEKYRIIFDATTSVVGRTDIYFRFRANGVDNTTNAYDNASYYIRSNGATGNFSSGTNTFFHLLITEHNNGYAFSGFDFYKPATTINTKRFYGLASHPMSGIAGSQAVFAGGCYFGTEQFDGFTFYPNQGNMTGTVSIYGYKN